MHVGWLQKDRRRCQAVVKLPTVAQLYQNLQQFVNLRLGKKFNFSEEVQLLGRS